MDINLEVYKNYAIFKNRISEMPYFQGFQRSILPIKGEFYMEKIFDKILNKLLEKERFYDGLLITRAQNNLTTIQP